MYICSKSKKKYFIYEVIFKTPSVWFKWIYSIKLCVLDLIVFKVFCTKVILCMYLYIYSNEIQIVVLHISNWFGHAFEVFSLVFCFAAVHQIWNLMSKKKIAIDLEVELLISREDWAAGEEWEVGRLICSPFGFENRGVWTPKFMDNKWWWWCAVQRVKPTCTLSKLCQWNG